MFGSKDSRSLLNFMSKPRIVELPCFTGRPDLPRWVPLAFHVGPEVQGFGWIDRSTQPLPIFESSSYLVLVWERGAPHFLRYWWSYGACAGRPG